MRAINNLTIPTKDSFLDWKTDIQADASIRTIIDSLEPFSMDLEDSNGCTFLHRAVSAGTAQTLIAGILLDADPNAEDDLGETPLHKAARHGSTFATQLLLAAGANPNHANKSGVSPLQVAIQKKQSRLHTIQALVEGGGNPYLIFENFAPRLKSTQDEQEYEDLLEITHREIAKKEVSALLFANSHRSMFVHDTAREISSILFNGRGQ